MRTNRIVWVLGIAGICVIVSGFVIGIAFGGGSDAAGTTCPDGKQLVAVHVTDKRGSLDVQGAKLPKGYSFETRGGGTVVAQDNHSATVIGNGPLELSVVCK